MKVSRPLVEAYRFFRGQGAAPNTALSLARAERLAKSHEWTFDWVADEEGAANWWCQCGCQPDEVLGCVCRDSEGRVMASLWSIGNPTREYARVVEAELALEAVS